jgi:hypothetical protein
VLGGDWNKSADRAWTTSSDAEGFHILVADKKDGYTWRTAASLAEPGFDADMWIGNVCLTGSGRRAVAAYAPRTFTNKPELMARGAFAAVVDLDTGKVTKLKRQVSLAYFSPGCGLGETAVFTQLGGEHKNATRLIKVDTRSARTAAPIRLKGQVTSAVPVGDAIVAADAARLVKITDSGRRTAVARTSQIPFLLKPDAEGGVVYLDRTAVSTRAAAPQQAQGRAMRVTAAAIDRPDAKKAQPALLATGPLTGMDLTGSADGRVFVTGQAKAAAGLPAVVQVRAGAPRDSVATSRGEALVTRTARTGGKDPRAAAAGRRTAEISLRTLSTGKETGFRVLPGKEGVARVVQGGRPSPALPAPGRPSGGSGGESRLRSATVDGDRTCAVPRNDPAKQAMQPKPRQVEWAVNMAITGNLNYHISRPANWKNLGMPAYRPQDPDMFPLTPLAGGGRVPMQVMLGITAQESNMWQAARFVVPGVTGNPLIGNYYGIEYTPDGEQQDPWAIDWAEADCGYGITQVTDGMRLPGKEKPGEVAKTSKQQQAIALDYTANIAAGVNILIEKWNQTYNAGLRIDNADPQWMETWYFALWAYNSGFYPASDAPENAGTWGLGFTNNPANPLWKANRPPFLSNWDGSEDDYSHAAHPQDWPYQEKVLGWAGHPLQGLESPGNMVVGFRPAWWTTTGNRVTVQPPENLFCNSDNSCDPSKIADGDANQPGLGACNRADLHCWWHHPASWKSCTSNVCGHEIWRFDPPADYPEQADGTAYPPNCTTSGLPAGALIVDDVPDGTPIHRPGCTIPQPSSGSFSFDFGSESAKIDLHQIGGGYGSHFWFAHSRNAASQYDRLRVTGTWKLDEPVGKPQVKVLVHIPDHGAQTPAARYEVATAGGWQEATIPQSTNQANKWVELGVFGASGITPAVRLSNDNPTGNGEDDVAYDAVAFVPGEWVTIPKITLPAADPNAPDPPFVDDKGIEVPVGLALNSGRSLAPGKRCAAAEGGSGTVCYTVSGAPPKLADGMAKAPAARAAPLADEACKLGYARLSRFSACATAYISADWNTPKGKGSAVWLAQQAFELNNTKGWRRVFGFQPFAFSTNLGAVTLDADITCGGPCTLKSMTTEGLATWASVSDKHLLKYTVDYEWQAGSTPGHATLTPGLNFDATSVVLGKTTTQEGRWTDPNLNVRCDNEAFENRPDKMGCVFPIVTPAMKVNARKHPAAAALYWLSMEKLASHPGSYKHQKPLHRIASKAVQKQNRDKMCKLAVAAWDPHPATPNASCDEYPFAATRESGGQTLPSGSLCAQFYAEPAANGTWELKIDGRRRLPTWNEPCSRGSIPEGQNTGAGGGVGTLPNARVLDGDPYYVDLPGFASCNAQICVPDL